MEAAFVMVGTTRSNWQARSTRRSLTNSVSVRWVRRLKKRQNAGTDKAASAASSAIEPIRA
ncbi:MAG: hypothetical protein ACRYFZ_04185 [Janthinobacterium lividum]